MDSTLRYHHTHWYLSITGTSKESRVYSSYGTTTSCKNDSTTRYLPFSSEAACVKNHYDGCTRELLVTTLSAGAALYPYANDCEDAFYHNSMYVVPIALLTCKRRLTLAKDGSVISINIFRDLVTLSLCGEESLKCPKYLDLRVVFGPVLCQRPVVNGYIG